MAAKSEKGRLGSTNGRLTGTRDEPVEVGEEAPGLVREESDGSQGLRLADLPTAGAEQASPIPKEESREELFVSDDSGGEPHAQVKPDRKHKGQATVGEQEIEDDKKKLALNTMYDGFSIYGRILCLVVKRRGTAKGKESAGGSGQAMMEEWIASTQMGDGMMDE